MSRFAICFRASVMKVAVIARVLVWAQQLARSGISALGERWNESTRSSYSRMSGRSTLSTVVDAPCLARPCAMTVWTVASVFTAVVSQGAAMPKMVWRSGIAAKRLRVTASSAAAPEGLGETAGWARYSSSFSVPASGLRERALLPLSYSRPAWTALTSASGSAYGRTCSCARSSSLAARTTAARTCPATAATSTNPGVRASAPVMRLMCDEARSAATLASVSHACACAAILSAFDIPEDIFAPRSSSRCFDWALP